jgi:hypothetical protein
VITTGGVAVRLAVAGALATVTFETADHPAGPAAQDRSPSLAAALAATGRELSGAVRVVVLRGDTWSLPPVTAQPPEPAGMPAGEHLAYDGQNGLGWLADRADLISVAAVAGPASGAGLCLALACDLRILSVDSALVLPEAGLGQLPGPGVAGRLVDLVGYSTALDLCLTGRPLTAAEASAAGVAQRLASRAGLDEAVETLVATLLAVPREVAIETKALLRGAAGLSARHQRAVERAAWARVLAVHPAG